MFCPYLPRVRNYTDLPYSSCETTKRILTKRHMKQVESQMCFIKIEFLLNGVRVASEGGGQSKITDNYPL